MTKDELIWKEQEKLIAKAVGPKPDNSDPLHTRMVALPYALSALDAMRDTTERKLEWACKQIEALLRRVAELEARPEVSRRLQEVRDAIRAAKAWGHQ